LVHFYWPSTQQAVVKQVAVTAREKPQKQGSGFAQYLLPHTYFLLA